MKKKEILLAVLSGFLLIPAFPKFNLWILAWVAFVPFFWAIRDKSPSQAAFLGFIAGFTFFTGLLYWIYNVLTLYGHLPGWISVFFLVLLTAYLALYFSLFTFLLRWAGHKSYFPEILIAPPLWVSLEYVRGLLFSGFPWELLGYSQFLILPLIQIADLTGVYGVSFLIILVNLALYRLSTALAGNGWRPALKEIIAAGILLALAVAYGWGKLSLLEEKAGTKPSYRISLIQGNIRQDIKWEPHFQEETLRIYSHLTHQVKGYRPDLIIWPETATPFFFQSAYPFQSRILELAQQMDAPLLFGAPAFERQGARINYFNSAFLVSPEKRILGRYDKIHLVPFGEYAPLSGLLGFTRDIIGAIGDFTPGKGIINLALPWGKFGVLVCYEVIFPNLTRQFVDQGAQFLINITNDAWFGRTSAPYQHLSMATFRAVENRVFIARAANTGISAFIDPRGMILQSSGLFTREVLSGIIFLNKAATFYSRYGDIFSYLCLAGAGLFFLLLYLKNLNRQFRGYCGERST